MTIPIALLMAAAASRESATENKTTTYSPTINQFVAIALMTPGYVVLVLKNVNV